MTTHEIRENAVLMTDNERAQVTTNEIASKASSVAISAMKDLSKRELQVVNKILEGNSNKAIANALFISERTVKFHCANIYKKLNITNRTALIANCFRTLYQEAVTP